MLEGCNFSETRYFFCRRLLPQHTKIHTYIQYNTVPKDSPLSLLSA